MSADRENEPAPTRYAWRLKANAWRLKAEAAEARVKELEEQAYHGRNQLHDAEAKVGALRIWIEECKKAEARVKELETDKGAWESRCKRAEARVKELEARLALERELVSAATDKRYAAEARVKGLEAALREAREDIGVIAEAGDVDCNFAFERIDRTLGSDT